MRRCKICKTPIEPAAKCTDFVGKKGFCSVDCAATWGQKAALTIRERNYRKDKAEARETLKTRSDHATEAQKAFNEYIRLRDHKLPCISCNRHHDGQYHAGHYRSTKAAASLRFNLFNVHKQCQPCNTHLSGNVVEYRINLVKRIGQARVDWLESQNEPRRFEIDYLKRLKAVFAKKVRIIKKIRNNNPLQ